MDNSGENKLNLNSTTKKEFCYCCDVSKNALSENFRKRGWKEVSGYDNSWNLYWASMQSCRLLFRMDYKFRMRDDQMINHFPNSIELSRKDLLIKNIKRYRKDLEREGSPLAEKYANNTEQDTVGGTRYKYLNYIPVTFELPADYNLFVLEFRKTSQCPWIMKPCGKSQGAGIFLVRKLNQLKKWAYDARSFYMPHLNRDSYVISKYIENPLLIGGRKFDLRLFVLVTSFSPLKAYMYNEGFCRFCSQKYDNTSREFNNVFVHLTNVSIQKLNEEYNLKTGGKWSLQNFLLFLESTRGSKVKDELVKSILSLMLHTLRAVAPVMANDRHCFEVYGFDIIIDENLKPWLIEVNSNPSIQGTTQADTALKSRLIDNVLNVVLPPNGIPNVHWNKTPHTDAAKNFTELSNDCLRQNEFAALKPKVKRTNMHAYASEARLLGGCMQSKCKTKLKAITAATTTTTTTNTNTIKTTGVIATKNIKHLRNANNNNNNNNTIAARTATTTTTTKRNATTNKNNTTSASLALKRTTAKKLDKAKRPSTSNSNNNKDKCKTLTKTSIMSTKTNRCAFNLKQYKKSSATSSTITTATTTTTATERKCKTVQKKSNSSSSGSNSSSNEISQISKQTKILKPHTYIFRTPSCETINSDY